MNDKHVPPIKTGPLTLGQALKIFRKNADMLQSELSDKLGLGPSGNRQICRWEKDEVIPKNNTIWIQMLKI